MTKTLLCLIPLVLLGCTVIDGDTDGDDPPDTIDDCNDCSSGQICVMEFSVEDTTRCEDIPAVCGSEAACDDGECQSAMYDYCPADTNGWGCSDTFPPTVISCNN